MSRASSTGSSSSRPVSRRLRRIAATVALPVAGLIVATTVAPISAASADPSAATWARLRNCESSGNYSINTGNGYYGAYQFDLGTWRSVGGTGYPNQNSPAVQDALALKLYRLRGWQPWTCATILGLREDDDARSGRTSDIHVGQTTGGSTSSGSTSGHASWPGRYWSVGQSASPLIPWQQKMASRGAPLRASGVMDAATLAVAKQVQLQNGLGGSGLLGPNTWALAWNGSYRKPATTVSHPAPAPTHGVSRTAPAMPGPSWFSTGDRAAAIGTWQRQMAARGAKGLHGSGQFGSTTLAVVKRLQTMNGLPATGILGPNTWKLAWTGKY